jgi:hypothetical protein
VGPEAPGLSPATSRRRTQGGHAARTPWPSRRLQGNREVSGGVEGVSGETRLAEARQWLLGMLGADASGPQARVGLWEGYCESAPSWQARRLDLTRHGLEHGPA